MSNYGRRQPRNMGGKDLQSLAVWVVIIGVIGYLLFPSFFKELYFSRTEAVTSTGGTNEVRLPGDYQSVSSNELPSEVYSEAGNNFKPLYGQDNAMATGYWAIMTVSGNLRELSLSGEDYAFILKMIQNDQSAPAQNQLFLTANGQIQKLIVSDEVFAILNNMAMIADRKMGTALKAE